MAAQALGPGTTIVRRRAFFGLLDAGGWAWATLKAAFWFVVIIMMMAYIPDRALYATVQPTQAGRGSGRRMPTCASESVKARGTGTRGNAWSSVTVRRRPSSSSRQAMQSARCPSTRARSAGAIW